MTVCINVIHLGIGIYLLIGLAFSSVIFSQNKKTMGAWPALGLGVVVGLFWIVFVLLVPFMRKSKKAPSGENQQ